MRNPIAAWLVASALLVPVCWTAAATVTALIVEGPAALHDGLTLIPAVLVATFFLGFAAALPYALIYTIYLIAVERFPRLEKNWAMVAGSCAVMAVPGILTYVLMSQDALPFIVPFAATAWSSILLPRLLLRSLRPGRILSAWR